MALKNLEEAIVDRILRAIAREQKRTRRRTPAMDDDGSTKHRRTWERRQGTVTGPIHDANRGGGVCAPVDCASE